MRKAFIKMMLLAIFVTNYNVVEGDTLQGIAQQFCQSNNQIQVAEFREGLRELNYSIVGEGEVNKGMVLTVVQFK